MGAKLENDSEAMETHFWKSEYGNTNFSLSAPYSFFFCLLLLGKALLQGPRKEGGRVVFTTRLKIIFSQPMIEQYNSFPSAWRTTLVFKCVSLLYP